MEAALQARPIHRAVAGGVVAKAGKHPLVHRQHGAIFQFLLSFLTFAQVSPDGTEVTAFFGALPIAPNLKWQFEATVADKTGATGWDWQVTRPGDL